MNARGEHELELAPNRAEPKNKAGLVPGPYPEPKKNFKIFFQNIKSATMPDHHVKGQPAAPTYVREKGCLKKDSNRETPCIKTKYTIKYPIIASYLENLHF